MSDAAQLACPHCSGRIAFTPELAGRVVTCPHCRGQLQMPGSLPNVPPPPSSASVPVQKPPVSATASSSPQGPPAKSKKKDKEKDKEKELEFFREEKDQKAVEERIAMRLRAEPMHFKQVQNLAIPFALSGIIGSTMICIVVVFYLVVPLFREATVDGVVNTQKMIAAVMCAIGVLAFFISSVIIWFLLRVIILVQLDSARTLRLIREQTEPPVKE